MLLSQQKRQGSLPDNAFSYVPGARQTWLVTFVLAGAILCFAFSPPRTVPERGDLFGSDKLRHIAAFFALILPAALFGRHRKALALFFAASLALLIEVFQPVIGREGSFIDFVASCGGIFLGWSVGKVLKAFALGDRKEDVSERKPDRAICRNMILPDLAHYQVDPIMRIAVDTVLALTRKRSRPLESER